MMMIFRFLFLSGILATQRLSSLSPNLVAAADEDCNDAADLWGTAWYPVSIYPDGQVTDPSLTKPMDVVDPTDMFIVFDDSRESCSFSGRSACNSYFGQYVTSDNVNPALTSSSPLSFRDTLWTEKFCSETWQLESAYLGALLSVASYRIITTMDGNSQQLEMLDENAEVLSFAPCEQMSLADYTGVTWTISSIEGRTFDTGKSLTLQFGSDGILRGSSACREYELTYWVYDYANHRLSINTPETWSPSSIQTCNPQEFARIDQYQNAILQEGELLFTLRNANEYHIEGCTNQLVIKPFDIRAYPLGN